MSKNSTLYDLMLLLSLGSEDDAREKIVADVETAIVAGGGTVALRQAWGRRPTAYRLAHQLEADYHLIQFTGPAALLESLSHTLGIADEVLRFRIIKVVPGTPDAPQTPPPVLAAVGATGAGHGAVAAAPAGDDDAD